MTLVDSLDSVLMVFAYSGSGRVGGVEEKGEPADDIGDGTDNKQGKRGERGVKRWLALVEKTEGNLLSTDRSEVNVQTGADDGELEFGAAISPPPKASSSVSPHAHAQPQIITSSMSSLSIALTLISILVAASIALITLMGLIGDVCGRCREAADREGESGDGGLEGRWWRFWARVRSDYVQLFVSCFILSLFIHLLIDCSFS